jgi:DNA invertase Pin-like site-specific DNA recombinase
MLIGYCRVSTDEQSLDLQLDALKHEGVEKVFQDTASGANDDRPGLAEALKFARPGDTLVVWRLDRLGRSVRHLVNTVHELEEQKIQLRSIQEQLDTGSPGGRLIFHVFGALAEFERDLLRQRTNAGLEAARRRGRIGGRKRKLSRDQVDEVLDAVTAGRRTQAEMARLFDVNPATISRIVAQHAN